MSSHMEVDGEPPPMFEPGSGGLKRCSSAPMINMLDGSAPATIANDNKQLTMDDSGKPSNGSLNMNSFSFTPSTSSFRPVDVKLRTRHYSTSSLLQSSHSSNNVSTPIKIPNRIHELKRDEEVQTKVHREINHEREMTSAIQMSQSWDEHFSLDDPVPTATCTEAHKNRPRSLSESLHIFTSGFPVASSPSPTRVGKQCFSPSMQAPVMFNGHNFNFTPSPSPSPTRSRARRSVSPIVHLKPSALSLKRKLDPDPDSGFSQPKRIFGGSLLSPASLQLSQSSQLVQQVHHNNSLRLGLDAHALRQHTHSSLSTGSFDDSASEHSSIGTLNNNTPSTSTAGPYGFSPLTTTDNCSTTTTDSEGDMYDSTNTNNSNSDNSCSNSLTPRSRQGNNR